jgi:hypothetical protein
MTKIALKPKDLNLFRSVLFCILVFLATIPLALPEAQAETADDQFHLTYDISGSLGNTSGRGYQEVSIGLNAFFNEWFNWRNSGFGRFIEGSDSVYGLDTSGRFVLNLGDAKLGLTAFVGPGYRFATSAGNSQADSAPFAEGGVTVKLGGLRIGGGVKTVFNSVVRSGAPEDTQYFLILGGGGVL